MSDSDHASSTSSPQPKTELNKWQKRQATLLYHFASMEYLQGLKRMVDDFVSGVDITLDVAQRQGRDRYLVSERWGVRDTVANFSTYGFPALREFQMSVATDVARRVTEFYDFSGYNQCARLLGELSMNWSTPEEEERFDKGMQTIGRYTSPLDNTMQHDWSDALFDTYWNESGGLFPRLPKFRVRTDVEAQSGHLPVRTGVYVPQDDPYGSLQFAWTGNSDGRLSDCSTFNALGLQAVSIVGRDGLSIPDPRLLLLARQPRYIEAFKARRNVQFTTEEEFLADPLKARVFVLVEGVERRPCKGYYVERVEGEFDEPEPEPKPHDGRLRGEPGELVPRSGWWFTLALKGNQGYRRFDQGDHFPETKLTDRGAVIWSFDPESQPQSERDEATLALAQRLASVEPLESADSRSLPLARNAAAVARLDRRGLTGEKPRLVRMGEAFGGGPIHRRLAPSAHARDRRHAAEVAARGHRAAALPNEV